MTSERAPGGSSPTSEPRDDDPLPRPLLEKLKLLPLRERELATLRQTHQQHLRWIQACQELMVRLTGAKTIPEAQAALLASLVGEFGFDISGASTPECILAGDPVRDLTPADRAFFDSVTTEAARTSALVISEGRGIEGTRTLGWLMGGVAGMADAGHEQVVIVGRTRRTAGYFPPPKEHEASLYRHLLSTVAQVFRSIALQSTHQQELERRVALRTAELKEAQERVVQLEREKIAEQMAGGFAHEMRNALSGAKILIEKGLDETGESGKSPIDRTASELKRMFLIAQKKLDDRTLAIFRSSIAQVVQNERLLDDVLRSVKRAVERALSITTLIMEYSRIGYSEPGADVVDLVSVAQAVVGECSELFAQHDVAATFRVEGTCLVRGTETHFYSIIKNLVANAFDALTEIDDDRPRSLIVDVHSAGDRTVIRVSDNAGGIPPEIRARIFEPFFSTKPQTGTGLGLGMVQKLVALHDGTLELDTTVGRGTTFTVSFAAATRSRDVRLEKAVG